MNIYNSFKIFLSYCWANTDIADSIDNDFRTLGIIFIRDIRDALYRTSLKDFMHQVGKMDFVTMIISDEYLKSENCMYEVLELLHTHEFNKRFLPVILPNANKIYKIDQRIEYYDYWNKKLKEAKELNNQYQNFDTVEHLKKCNEICNHLDDFFVKVVTTNTSNYESLKADDYNDILRVVGFSNLTFHNQMRSINKILDSEEKEIELDKFIHSYPNISSGYYLKGVLCFEKQQYRLCIHYMERVIEFSNTSVINISIPYGMIGYIYASQFKQYDKALKYYLLAYETPNYDLSILDNMAKVYENSHQFEKAKELYLIAISKNPNNDDYYASYGMLLMNELKDYKEAENNFKKSLNISKQNITANKGLGLLYTKYIHKIDEAIKYLRTAFNSNSKDSETNVYLGNYYTLQKDCNKAEKFYLRAVKYNQNHDLAYYNLAVNVDLRRNNPENALKHLNRAIELTPTYYSAIFRKATLLFRHFGQADEAINLLKEIIYKDYTQEKIDYSLSPKSFFEKYQIHREVYDNLKETTSDVMIFSCSNLGTIYMAKRSPSEALYFFNLALYFDQLQAGIIYNAAVLSLKFYGDFDTFRHLYIKATDIDTIFINDDIDKDLKILRDISNIKKPAKSDFDFVPI